MIILIGNLYRAHLNARSHHLMVRDVNFLSLHEAYKDLYETLGNLADELQELTFEIEWDDESVYDLSEAMSYSNVSNNTGLANAERINESIVWDLHVINTSINNQLVSQDSEYIRHRLMNVKEIISKLIYKYGRSFPYEPPTDALVGV